MSTRFRTLASLGFFCAAIFFSNLAARSQNQNANFASRNLSHSQKNSAETSSSRFPGFSRPNLTLNTPSPFSDFDLAFEPSATPNSPQQTPEFEFPSTKSPDRVLDNGGANETLATIARRLNLPLPLPNGRVVISKSKRQLELWSGARRVKTYQVALGANPVGAKKRQHDSRTPEGHFTICTRNSTTSAFHIFLGLSYPGLPDAKRGVSNGAISWREYALIQRKLASRSAPLWETRLGGWIGIHGGTGSAFAKKQAQKRGRADWTAGCIALTNREIEEIYRATKMGTPVWIQP